MKFSTANLFLLSLLSLLCSCSKQKNEPLIIDPPFTSIPANYSQFELDPSEVHLIRLETGSSIEIPENAFLDKNGKPVTGKVSLKFREFHSATDIISSGIPMTTYTNGKTNYLESGGMFELTATSDGQEITIAPNKKITVSLASDVEGDFDFYYLEDANPLSISTAGLFPEALAGNSTVKKEYRWKKIYSPKDSLAKLATAKSTLGKIFKMRFNKDSFPEAAALDTMQWNYAGKQKNEDPLDPSNSWTKNVVWDVLNISKPIYYAQLVRDINLNNGRTSNGMDLYGNYNYLPDSAGFLAEDGANHVTHYGWDGAIKNKYVGVTKIDGWDFLNGDEVINKQNTHIIMEDSAYNHKLYLINGTLVKNIGPAERIFFSEDGEKIAYQKLSENLIRIISLTGEQLLSIPYDHNTIWHIAEDGKYLTIIKNKKLEVLDFSGKTLAKRSIATKTYVHFTNDNYTLLLQHSNYPPVAWDWKSNIEYKSTFKTHEQAHFQMHPTESIVLARDENSMAYVWNWRTNYFKMLTENEYNHLQFSPKGNFIVNYELSSNKKANNSLRDNTGKTIIDADTVSNRYYMFSTTENQTLQYTYEGNENKISTIRLFDSTGALIKDLSKIDPTISHAIFTRNQSILTTSNKGIVGILDLQGKLLKTINTQKKNSFAYTILSSDSMFTTFSKIKPQEIWGYNSSQPLYSLDMSHYASYAFLKDDIQNNYGTVLTNTKYKKTRLWKMTNKPLEKDVYKLNFANDSTDFNTYVHLSGKQLEVCLNYTKLLEARFNKEEERKEGESKLVRVFAINKFGIYNWDKLYDDATMLTVNATLQIKDASKINSFTYFLITGKDKSTVIKYTKESMSKFRFNPSDNNCLMVVLPDNKIGIYSFEAFQKLDKEKIKKEGKLSIQIEVLAEQASEKLFAEQFKKPS